MSAPAPQPNWKQEVKPSAEPAAEKPAADTGAAADNPAAVPERIIWTQSFLPCSAVMIPPFDLVRRGSAGTPTSLSAFCSEPR